MDWMALLPLTMGCEDMELAQHASDEERLQTMIKEARGTGFTDDDIRQSLGEYLALRSATAEHKARQLARLDDFLGVQ